MAKGTTSYRDEGQTSPASQSGYVRLAAAILGQAAKEARAGDLDAGAWLLSEQAELLADGIGLSWPHVQRWARARLQLQNDKPKRESDLANNRLAGLRDSVGNSGRIISRT
jgi:hypothetical protein